MTQNSLKTGLLERCHQQWAILPEALDRRIQRIAALSLDKPTAQLPNRPDEDWYGNKIEKMRVANGTAIIPIKGTLVSGATPFEKYVWGDVDYMDIAEDIDEAEKLGVADVVFDVDSPGGTVMGSDELMGKIKSLKDRRNVMSFTRGVMASAAYKVVMPGALFASTSAIVGSIGVILAVATMERRLDEMGIEMNLFTSGRYKGTGFPYKDMPREHRDRLEIEVAASGQKFREEVHDFRPEIDPEDMEGQVFTGEQGALNGYVDGTDDPKR